MSAAPADSSAPVTVPRDLWLVCCRCNYDLRAHDPAAVCPECGTSVAESARVAAVPRDLDWADRDPRWRRRVLAGVWVLVLFPLVGLLDRGGVLETIPAPATGWALGTADTLADTLLTYPGLSLTMFFMAGSALIFARERSPADRRSWRFVRLVGLSGTVVACGVCLASIAFIMSLVMVGISSLLLNIPPKFQPAFTADFAQVSFLLLRYGPQPGNAAAYAAVIASAVAVLLACLVLYDAMVSTLPRGRRRRPEGNLVRRWTALPVVCLALFAGLQILEAVLAASGLLRNAPGVTAFANSPAILSYALFFREDLLIESVLRWSFPPLQSAIFLGGPVAEMLKWLSLLAAALWLTVAQFLTYRRPVGAPPMIPIPSPDKLRSSP